MGNINIPSLPLAIGLDGTEQVWVVQGGTTDKRTTTRSVASLFTTGFVNPNTIVGNNTNSIAPPTGLTVPQVQALAGQAFGIFVLRGVDFNIANSDNVFNITLPTGFVRYQINRIAINSATGSLTTATAGVFTGAGATGTTVVTSGTTITVSTALDNTLNNMQSVTLQTGGASTSVTFPQMFFRVQNPQGSPAFANVTLIISYLS